MARRIRTPPASVPKPRYRVANWGECNRALVARGSITLWIHEAVLAGWRATGGKGWRYSDAAIFAALSLRTVFRLTLAPDPGFPPRSDAAARPGDRGAALFDLLPARSKCRSECKVRVHGKAKRRVRRKLHLGVDTTTGAIVAHALTPKETHDGAELEGLLGDIEGPIAAVYGDGAYDAFDIHAAVLARGARPVIPPRKGAAIRPPPKLKTPPPAAPPSPASPRSAARPGSRRPATTAARSPRPGCTATRPSSAPA
jgi:hypothetical protein